MAASLTRQVPCRLRLEVRLFDIKLHCLFCGETADKSAELKKPSKYCRSMHEVSTLILQEQAHNQGAGWRGSHDFSPEIKRSAPEGK